MQQSSLEFFCEECGAANPDDATMCVACQQPLTRSPAALPAPVRPLTVTPAPTLQVVAGDALPPTATPGETTDVLPPGTVLQKRYSIEQEIGQGGYSTVYRARDRKRYGRRVAIKQINLRDLTPRQVIEATETFNRETALLPALSHEGIPRFYGHFTDPEHWYLVMEYIKGQTLEDYLAKSTEHGACSVVEALRIGIKLSSILDYLHTLKPPLIFRDVKPANILLTRRKKLYLIDFGIARSFSPNKRKDTTPLGSPGYAAPEQYGRAQSDARTDIYGLGATLQTLLTGRDPLELRAGEPPQTQKPIPPHVQQLLDSMLDPSPYNRPRTMADVKQSLQIALAKVRRVFLFLLGAGLGAIFALWGYLTFVAFLHTFSVLAFASACFCGLTIAVGLILLPVFLITPSKRAIALGIVTAIVLAILLLVVRVLVFP